MFKEIDSDAAIQDMIARIRSHSFSGNHFHLVENRLWYKNKLEVSKTSAFIPVLKEFHDSQMGEKHGVLKTLKRVQTSFHWDGMQKDIQQYVAACSVCQTYKYYTLSPAGLLQPLPIPTAIWEDISLDFIEGLPLSWGVNVILVVIDRLSKAAHFVGLKHHFKAIDVASKFVQKLFTYMGFLSLLYRIET